MIFNTGAVNEYQVIQKLGSPQQVAQTILADYGSGTKKGMSKSTKILIAIGLLLVLLISWVCIKWLPALVRAIVRWIKGLRKPQEGGDGDLRIFDFVEKEIIKTDKDSDVKVDTDFDGEKTYTISEEYSYLDVEAGMGQVNIEVNGSETAYSYNVECGIGEVRVQFVEEE